MIRVADFGLAVQLRPGQQCRNLVGTPEYVGELYECVFVCVCVCVSGFLVFESTLLGSKVLDINCSMCMCVYCLFIENL